MKEGFITSDLLIRGLEMPHDPNGVTICIFPDGIAKCMDMVSFEITTKEAVSVPAHGRLINADELAQKVKEEAEKFVAMNAYDSGLRMGYRAAVKAINIAPTIIPASE